MASTLQFSPSLLPSSSSSSSSWLTHKIPSPLLSLKTHFHFHFPSLSPSSSVSFSRPSIHTTRKFSTASDTAELEDVMESETDEMDDESESAQVTELQEIPKGQEVFAVVMVGSRQYIVFPGRHLTVQRLKGANVNDKIILNKVLLVSTKTDTYIGKPVVPNAAVHAIVEENGLNRKVIVFKFKKKKNYKRNIGHRQPNTRIRIMGITGFEDAPAAAPLPASFPR